MKKYTKSFINYLKCSNAAIFLWQAVPKWRRWLLGTKKGVNVKVHWKTAKFIHSFSQKKQKIIIICTNKNNYQILNKGGGDANPGECWVVKSNQNKEIYSLERTCSFQTWHFFLLLIVFLEQREEMFCLDKYGFSQYTFKLNLHIFDRHCVVGAVLQTAS